ncbi:c-type cytochrome biogenesis protein CcsB [Sulfurihydrogenibium sp.]|uniref:c-type cytochrome biogenesis protein CcsB n=1 Tax=Sulfurihydrogenibium sp. TaxID=2053621 RepID=UPI0026362B2F|nr:c-type cytochrome biogenesis protein CcsB [Sulfurihydrogenibium sp.]
METVVFENRSKNNYLQAVLFSTLILVFVGGSVALAILSGKVSNVLVFQISGFIYGLSALMYIFQFFFKNENVGKVGTLFAFLGWLTQTVGLFLRGLESYYMGIFHPPWTNLYESLMFFPWLAVGLYLYIEREYKTKVIGTFFMPIVAFLVIWGHKFNTDINPLVPALRSYWLYLHVLASFVGYAGFTVSFGASFAYLIKHNFNKEVEVKSVYYLGFVFFLVLSGIFGYLTLTGAKDIKTMMFGVIFILSLLGLLYFAVYVLKPIGKVLPSENILSEIAFKAVAISFPIWTASIMLGGAWANEAWGSYWSWDPKETWALIVWLFFAAYIHGRTIGKWKGTTSSWIVVAGFIMLLICYFGVNLYFPGLHSYATE